MNGDYIVYEEQKPAFTLSLSEYDTKKASNGYLNLKLSVNATDEFLSKQSSGELMKLLDPSIKLSVSTNESEAAINAHLEMFSAQVLDVSYHAEKTAN